MITQQQTAEQKDRLPTGWGRFGKAIDHLIQVSQPDEELLAACVTLNPTFVHRSITLAGAVYELTKSMNVVLAATNHRLIIVATGAGGSPMRDETLSYTGLEIVARDKEGIDAALAGWRSAIPRRSETDVAIAADGARWTNSSRRRQCRSRQLSAPGAVHISRLAASRSDRRSESRRD